MWRLFRGQIAGHSRNDGTKVQWSGWAGSEATDNGWRTGVYHSQMMEVCVKKVNPSELNQEIGLTKNGLPLIYNKISKQ